MQEVINSLPKCENGDPDITKLPPDTVRNVILNCLATYAVTDKRESFYVYNLGRIILDGNTIPEKYLKFLEKVLNTQTLQTNDKGETKGIYFSWVIAQVLEELGLAQE